MTLSLGFIWSFSSSCMVKMLSVFASASPSTAVSTLEDGDRELEARLRRGELDVVIAATGLPGLPRLKPINGLNNLNLWLEPLCAAVPSGTGMTTLMWSDLAGQRLLCRPQDDWRRFVAHVERLGGPTLTFHEQQVSQEALLRLVATGLGWFIAPASIVHSAVQGVNILPIVSEGAVLQIEALWRPQNLNPALSLFLKLARQVFAQSVEDDAPQQTHDPWP